MPPEERAGCLECGGPGGGLRDDASSSGAVRRSLSAPHPPTFDPASCDAQLRYHCDLVTRTGSDLFRYPSPLHAVAIQTPGLLSGHGRGEAGADAAAPPSAAPPAPRSSSWPPNKRLDGYIYSLLQRRALPVRTGKPRTSISADPSKSVLRHASLCVRPGSGTPRPSELKTRWPDDGGPASPQRPKRGEQETQKGSQTGSEVPNKDFYLSTKRSSSTPRETKQNPDQELVLKLTTTGGASSRGSRGSEPSQLKSERRGDKSYCRSKKARLPEGGGSNHGKVSRRPPGVSSSRGHRLPGSIPEGRVLDRRTTSVLAKPKHKRSDYRHLRAAMEVQYEEAIRRAQRRRRQELLLRGPSSFGGGSDSEYSAECASLFHSTIVDTSEDERSNYTTNRFGDSESSEEDVEDSGTEEGGAGGVSRGWSHGWAAGREATPAKTKAFVKIKASHTLKKKIQRFRSGSLKLMTTV